MAKYEKYSTFRNNKNYCSSSEAFCDCQRQSVGKLFCVLTDNSIDKKTEDGKSLSITGAITNVSKGDMVTPEIFQQIKDLLQEIHDFGAAGKREHPKQENIDNIEIPKSASDENFEKLTVDYYNKVLDALDVLPDDDCRKKTKEIIESDDFIQQLGTKIKNYEIDEDRCNVCNTNKNCGQYVPKPTTPTTPIVTRACIFFQFFFFGGSSSSGDSGDGCGCSGQCLHEESNPRCSTCEIGNNYGAFGGS